MSPAFLKRFDIITLEDQLKPYCDLQNSEKDLLELIDILMKQHSFNYHSNIKKNKEDVLINEKLNKYSKFLKVNLKINNEEKKLDFKYTTNRKLNIIIFKKVSNLIKKGELSIYKLSLFCRAVYIFTQELDPKNELGFENLVNYAFLLTISLNIEDDNLVEDYIYKKFFLNYKPEISIDNKFFFSRISKTSFIYGKIISFFND